MHFPYHQFMSSNKFKVCNCLFSVEAYLVAVNTPVNLKVEKFRSPFQFFQQRSVLYTLNPLEYIRAHF